MKKRSIIIISIVLIFILGLTVIALNSQTPDYKNRSVDDWYKDVTNGKKVITVYGASYCSHCQEYYPVITKLANKYDLDLYFFEVDTLSKENPDAYDKLMNSFEISDYDGSVPFTYIMNHTEYKASTTGFASREYTINFLKDNGVIKD